MVFQAIKTLVAVTALAAACADAQQVRVRSYTYDGTTVAGILAVENLGFSKTVNVIYADGARKWGTVCPAFYASGPFGSTQNRETWAFDCVTPAGITEFYVEYSVNGQKYFDSNGGFGANYRVSAMAPPPVGAPGFQSDVSQFLDNGASLFKQYLLTNISPNLPRALPGSVIAASPNAANNYLYHWVRDAALVMDVVNSLYKAGDKSLEKTFWDHAAFTKRVQNLNTLTGLGEVKFEIDAGDFRDPWCRPQNDGPALRASSFIRFANAYLAQGGDRARVVELYNGTTGVIKPDLEYTSRTFTDANGCDLWEEIRGLHFFTMAAQRRAMYEGRDFANSLGDTGAAAWYGRQAAAIDVRIREFWNPEKGAVESQLKGRLLDAAVALGAIHGNVGDGLFAPEDDRILASLYKLAVGFMPEYNLNQRVRADAAGQPLSVAIGRYYGDVYDGSSSNSLGNPWYLTTAAVAETMYRAAIAYVKAGSVTVTPLNQKLFNGRAPAGVGLNVAVGTYPAGSAEFRTIIRGLQNYADKYVRRIRFHGSPGTRFNEQYSRETGFATGVSDLTWSYASLLTVNFARTELRELTANL